MHLLPSCVEVEVCLQTDPPSIKKERQERKIALSRFQLLRSHDCSPPGSSVHGILQARILEWVAISFSRGASWPKNWTQVSRTEDRWFKRDGPIDELIQADSTFPRKLYWCLRKIQLVLWWPIQAPCHIKYSGIRVVVSPEGSGVSEINHSG